MDRNEKPPAEDHRSGLAAPPGVKLPESCCDMEAQTDVIVVVL